MESLHDRKLQSLVESVKRKTHAHFHTYPDFAPTALPRLKVNFEDMMKVTPNDNFEDNFNVMQQMRNADANTKLYRKMYLETVDRDIQSIKLQLDNPSMTKDTSDVLFKQLEEKLKTRIEQTDPAYNQKINAIVTEVQSMKAQYERKEAETIMKDYKFMSSLSGNATLGGAMIQLGPINNSYQKLLQLESNARRKRLEGFDIAGADVEQGVQPAGLPKGAPPADAPPVGAPFGGEGEGGGGGGGGGGGKAGEAEEKPLKKKEIPLPPPGVKAPPAPPAKPVETMHISRIPSSGKGTEAELILLDARKIFGAKAKGPEGMTPTQKLAEIKRLRDIGLIISDGRKGRPAKGGD
jgi:hypothetical protein